MRRTVSALCRACKCQTYWTFRWNLSLHLGRSGYDSNQYRLDYLECASLIDFAFTDQYPIGIQSHWVCWDPQTNGSALMLSHEVTSNIVSCPNVAFVAYIQ